MTEYIDRMKEVEGNLDEFMENLTTREARSRVIIKRSMTQMAQVMEDWTAIMRVYGRYGHQPPKEVLSEKIMAFHLSLHDYMDTIKNLGLLVFEYKEETRILFDISLEIFDVYHNFIQDMGMKIMQEGDWL